MLDLSVSWLRSLAFAVTQGLNSRFAGRKPAVILIGFGPYLLTYALFGGLMSSAMSRETRSAKRSRSGRRPRRSAR